MSEGPRVKVFRSATCRDLLRLAMESARGLESVSGDTVRYDADSRVLELTEDPTYLEVRSEEVGRKLGGEGPVVITFNDPAVAETERCCFRDKIELASELAELLIEGRSKEFARRVKELPEVALVELGGDPRYEPVALHSPLTR
ncbi:hypothetical protein [Methanopyrus kandleri]|jgi:hypothetical protein